MPANPFAALPSVTVIDEDYTDILTRLKTGYQQATGVYPMHAHPETFLLEQLAYESQLLRQLINEESRQNLLALSRGDRLDHLGALLDTPRLPTQPARTVIEFALHDHTHPITIPANTQIRASDGETLFATVESHTATPGTNTLAIIAQCQTHGTTGNGFSAGEIAELVADAPSVVTAQNTTISAGGTAVENDQHYRLRIHLSPSKFSTAGSEDSYIYHTLSAHQSIINAKAWTPDNEPGNVYICALLQGGQVPDAPLWALIAQAVGAKKVRPMTDHLIYTNPVPVPFSLEINLVLKGSHSALAETTRQTAQDRLTELTDRWRNTLGQDIIPEAMIERTQSLPGIYRATLNSLTYQTLEKHEFPDCADIQVTVSVVQEMS